jgi:hypothetical protein
VLSPLQTSLLSCVYISYRPYACYMSGVSHPCIHCLFNGQLGVEWLKMDWKRCGKSRSWPNLRYCPEIYLEGLGESRRDLMEDNRCPGRDSNPTSPEHKLQAFPIEPICFVSWFDHCNNTRFCSRRRKSLHSKLHGFVRLAAMTLVYNSVVYLFTISVAAMGIQFRILLIVYLYANH